MTTTKEKIEEVCSRLGITIESSGGRFHNKDDWDCIKFDVTLNRNGKEVWSGPYHLGLGNVKIPQGTVPRMLMNLTSDEENLCYTLQREPYAKVKPEYEKVKASLYNKLAQRQKVAPRLTDVINSLLMDGAAQFDSQTFSEWCSELGYNDDSIKAKKLWETCVETGMALRNKFKPDEIEQLRDAAQDY